MPRMIVLAIFNFCGCGLLYNQFLGGGTFFLVRGGEVTLVGTKLPKDYCDYIGQLFTEMWQIYCRSCDSCQKTAGRKKC